ncbi:exopolysaccharide biosynthesis protein [Candidatus Coxiella mudrowiae]|uniref:exopolysaccharide biosynthesis protein n=1 Tax=Candidatus Coxiella mudrowiae TaxID=2054173 RepID=UPI003144F0A3
MFKILGYIKKLERLLHPRLTFMTSGVMEIINGIVIFLFRFSVTPLLISFSNFIFEILY